MKPLSSAWKNSGSKRAGSCSSAARRGYALSDFTDALFITLGILFQQYLARDILLQHDGTVFTLHSGPSIS
jgi:hypothetical protein